MCKRLPPSLSCRLRQRADNSGCVPRLLFAKTPKSSVPSPRIRLVAFQRVRNIAPKASVPVELRAEPSFHSVVVETSDPYRPTVQVEAGPLLLYLGPTWLGRGEVADPTPDATVTIASTKVLDEC